MLRLDFPLYKCDTGFGTDHCVAWVMKSISALCCGHRSNLVACVKRKHAFSRVLRCSQLCQSERRVLTFIFVKVKSLSSKPAALKQNRTEQPFIWTSVEKNTNNKDSQKKMDQYNRSLNDACL